MMIEEELEKLHDASDNGESEHQSFCTGRFWYSSSS